MSLSDDARTGVRFVRRLSVGLVLSAVLVLTGARLALAHEGHDHGAATPALPATVKPRVAVETDLYQLVGIATGEHLVIYLDRSASNLPLTDASLTILSGDRTIAASRRADGSYEADVPSLSTPGRHELVFNVSHSDGDDLLAGAIEIAAPAAADPGHQHAPSSRILQLALPGLILLAGIGLGIAIKSRRVWTAAAVAALCVALLATAANAHEGHEHGPMPDGASLSGDVPRRLPDGSVFLPKPSQRLLSIRSQIAVEGEAKRAVSLVGRIIADPNRSGVVQSIAGGRVSPPEGGLPRLGQTVRSGEVLARIDPALPLADQSTLAEKQRDLEGAILLARQKHDRLARLGAPNVARGTIEDAELEIVNLEKRLASLKTATLQPEILTAPIDGVVSASRVVAGQVVAAQDLLFQIVDPSCVWVEALLFDQLDPGAIADASAVTAKGTRMQLSYRGRGRALQAQAVQIQFAVLEPPAHVSIGLPVTVMAQTAERLRGLLLPRDALTRGAAGETVVWQQNEPERFVPRQISYEPFDGAQVLVTGGIVTGNRIVVHGAAALSQVR